MVSSCSDPLVEGEGIRWDVLIPVKSLFLAKSRMRVAHTDVRAHLSLAFVRDTVAAVHACPQVAGLYMTTADPHIRRAAVGWGATVIPEGEPSGLNAAIRSAVAFEALRASDKPCAVLTSDIPAVQVWELSAALTAASRFERAVVPDAEGEGTVLLAAASATNIDPLFGEGSCLKHERAGSQVLVGDWPGLRRDVDTLPNLEAAAQIGLGQNSKDAAARLLSV